MSYRTGPKAIGWGRWRDLTDRAYVPEGGELIAWKTNRVYSARLFHAPTAWGEMVCLSIMRRDGKPIRDWHDLQRVKDELVGEERTAVEVYPPKAEIVDPSNIYYLWVLPEGKVLPFTLHAPGEEGDRRLLGEEAVLL